MRFFSSIDFGLFLIVLIALLRSQETNGHLEEMCRPGNCMAMNKCEIVATKSLRCKNPKETCCSLVKAEYRTLCQQWGGECMDSCNAKLVQKSTDCVAPKTCCVLV